MLTAKVGENIVNCFDNKYDRYTLKQWSNKGILKCPVCDGEYEYCHGEVVAPYFRHIGKECEGYFHESETDEHRSGKLLLYNWVKQQEGIVNCKLEAWIPETKQRPDIYFEHNGNKYVIEYQCTPIASEFLQRRELYRLNNINDIWILGTDKYAISINKDGSATHSKYSKSIEKELLPKGVIYLNSKSKCVVLNQTFLPFNSKIRNSKFRIADVIKMIFKKYSYGDFYFVESINNLRFINDYISIENSITDMFKVVENFYITEAERVLEEERKINEKRKIADKVSVFFGRVGDMVNSNMMLVEKKNFKSIFNNITTFYKFIDQNGNIFIWFSTSNPSMYVGNIYTVNGVIKDHSEYMGVKQTVLSKCKKLEGLNEQN